MARAGVTTQRIVDVAAQLTDEVGPEQVSLAAIAARLGVRVPSLYKHISNLAEVQSLVSERSRFELAHCMEQATIGRSGRSAIAAVATAIRHWAHQHPGRYATTLRGHDPQGGEPTAATAQALRVYLRVLNSGDDRVSEDVVVRARALRSAIHGFIDLELHGGFGLPTDIEVSFEWLINGIATLVMPTPDESTDQQLRR